MSKIYLISPLIIAMTLTACGQKGDLYLPKKSAEQTKMVENSPTQTASLDDQTRQTSPISTVSDKAQDSQHDY